MISKYLKIGEKLEIEEIPNESSENGIDAGRKT